MASLPALVYWEDPVQTGAVFGSVLVGLVSLASCSFQTPGPECVAGIKGAGVRSGYSGSHSLDLHPYKTGG